MFEDSSALAPACPDVHVLPLILEILPGRSSHPTRGGSKKVIHTDGIINGSASAGKRNHFGRQEMDRSDEVRCSTSSGISKPSP